MAEHVRHRDPCLSTLAKLWPVLGDPVKARCPEFDAYQACALRALGLLLYSRILQWEGERLFDRSAGFFYGNSCNSGTESRKIVPKVGN